MMFCSFRMVGNNLSRLLHSNCTPFKKSASIILSFSKSLSDQLSVYLPLKAWRSCEKVQDFNVLLFERPNSAKRFANKLVFPGGLIDKADFSSKWNRLFPNLIDFHPVKPLCSPHLYTQSFCRDRNPSNLSPQLAFRICALRELFEETGILLVEHVSTNQSKQSVCALLMDPTDLRAWQSDVLTNPERFLDLYVQLDAHPPLCNIYDWSNWLTPSCYSPRFDTIFYFTQMGAIRTVQNMKNSEIPQSVEVLQLYADMPLAFLPLSSKLFVAPQAYELGRLAQFSSLQSLSEFAQRRADLGCRRWTPLVVDFKVAGQPCNLVVLPGDERYDSLRNSTTTKAQCNLNAAELAMDTKRNRLLLSSSATSEDVWFDSNVYELGHVTPMNWSEYRRTVQI